MKSLFIFVLLMAVIICMVSCDGKGKNKDKDSKEKGPKAKDSKEDSKSEDSNSIENDSESKESNSKEKGIKEKHGKEKGSKKKDSKEKGGGEDEHSGGGSDCPYGPAGPCGPCGPDGPYGPAGPCGPCGPDGPYGPAGPCGPYGPELCGGHREQICGPDSGRDCLQNYAMAHFCCAGVTRRRSSTATWDVTLGFHLNFLNVTAITRRTHLSNMHIKVLDVSICGDKLVISIEIEDPCCFAPDTYFLFHKDCAEPYVKKDDVTCCYGKTIITITLDNTGPIDQNTWRRGTFFAYFEDQSLDIRVGDRLLADSNPVVGKALLDIVNNPGRTKQAIWLTKVYPVATALFQNILCDLGIKLQDGLSTEVAERSEDCCDEEDNIYYPCKDEEDLDKCVAKFLDVHGSCSLSCGCDADEEHPGRHTTTRERISVYSSFYNMTITRHHHEITTDGYVTDLKWNKRTGNVILGLHVCARIDAPSATCTVHRPCHPPYSVHSSTESEYCNQITVVIPAGIPGKCGKIKIYPQTLISSFFVGRPEKTWFDVGPEMKEDEVTGPVIEELFAHPEVAGEQIRVTEVVHMAINYIQSSLCDFHIDTCTDDFLKDRYM